jgi:hypothetical protein
MLFYMEGVSKVFPGALGISKSLIAQAVIFLVLNLVYFKKKFANFEKMSYVCFPKI